MSTGSGIPTALRQSNKEVLDIQNSQVPPSTILYLLQEAVKLAPPAKQDGLHSRAMGGVWSREHQQGPSPASASTGYCRNHGEREPQPNYTGSLSLLSAGPGSSPWEVMSLINLQCERLLHPGNGEEEEAAVPVPACKGTASSIGEFKSIGHSRMLSGFKECDASPAVPQHSEEAVGVAEALGACSRGEQVGFAGECGRNSDEIESLQCNKYMVEGSPVQLQIAAMADGGCRAIHAHGEANQAIGWIQVAGTQSGDTCCLTNCSISKETENRLLSGEIPTVLSPAGKEQGLYGKHGAPQSEPNLNLLASLVHQDIQQLGSSFSVNTGLCTFVPGASLISDCGVNMDCNSNVIPSCDSSKHLQSQALPNHSSGKSENLKPAPEEAVLALHSEPQGSSGDQRVKLKAARPLSDLRGRARKPRKQSHPTRSADLCDPSFKGVTFRMHTELNERRDQCRLLITSNYSAEFLKSSRRLRAGRPRSVVSFLKTSSSEEESDSSGFAKNKMCASCNTKKTPLWRVAEDGTPLCNACGIRYKKYGVRCLQCWHIPRKEGNSNSKCYRCGDVLRLAASQRKLTGW
ncbi:hypothetical protein AAFF_G00297660 [Aldrovandia affinis]|uniref:GATA-type domain-containing protein n=1 Tax=Aldrovandia affinis TaxID=143900 RepID=A0AAD7SQC8_9TELE|nr:hypothetical protein AAFF_G00297660 [Aldrovandia affinis]